MFSEEWLGKNSMNWRTRIVETNWNVIEEKFVIAHLRISDKSSYEK